MERQVSGSNTGHQTEEDGADNGTADVYAHNAASFCSVQTKAFANQRYVRFTGDRVGRADGLAFQTDHDGQRYADKNSSQVTKFLQNQRRGCR